LGKSISITPFSRVEGDLRIKIDIEDNLVKDARASGVMYRGFEKILKGHFPEDALVYTPRICGICCISHSIASASALGAISEEFTPSRSGQIAKNISHATENAMSHITQFYLYFLPDLTDDRFADFSFHKDIKSRFSTMTGSSTIRVMEERKKFLEILGYIIGKWPHTLAIHPGGITKSLDSSDIYHINGALLRFIRFIESVLIGMPLKEYLNIKDSSSFDAVFSGKGGEISDLGLFYIFAKERGLMELGKGPGRFLSGGAYLQPEGGHLFRPGYWNNGLSDLEPDAITESISYSYFNYAKEVSNPFDDYSEPSAKKESAYSWAKAPRYRKSVVEVGAIARQVISGDPLVMDFYQTYGSTVFTRVFARVHEAMKLLSVMREWISWLDHQEKYYVKTTLKKDARGAGITEAARGFLGHWIVVESGKIMNYQVITPTAFNCSPRDESGTPGPIEQAVAGTRIESEENPIEVDLILRSFDPCLVCTVH